ncbi:MULTISPECIES: rhamnogalacturonan acetylesterase [Bacillus]|uniref:rhamnogalacturonan acetylesterase n=1 Tax=Bacillus TaxID=1386 RepID=UPI00265F0272|nr:rhamnogalacturonan acetylesterase [Bacillus glycinifermentans]
MENIQLFLAGDSTVSYYDASAAPRAGWGQRIGAFLNQGVLVHNEAASGRSSKSFIEEGRLERIMEHMRNGDYLFVQFGHNDQKPDERHTEPYGSYQAYLRKYVECARMKQANPVLITPVQRRSFDSEGRLRDTHGDYPDAMRQLAAELRVPLIDLTSKSGRLLQTLGPESSKKLFLWLKPGEHPNYPDGAEDDTHFCEYGAGVIAGLVAEGAKEAGLAL